MFARACRTLLRVTCAAPVHSTTLCYFSQQPLVLTRLLTVEQTRCAHNSAVARAHRQKHSLLTLNQEQLESSGQQVLDFSGRYPIVALKDGQKSWRVPYNKSISRKFPPDTQGVLYYHHPGQIRFRLCRDIQAFTQGTDLLAPNGQTWSIDLTRALPKRSESGRSALFSLISDERLSHSNWHIIPGRHITTLSPINTIDQQVTDLSDSTYPTIYLGPAGSTLNLNYSKTFVGRETDIIPFPQGTVGVFYYKQSTSAPTRIGELRFRLCNNVAVFDQGTDLRLPSGDIWNVDSDQILFGQRYKPVRELLSQEGLLDCRTYLDVVSDTGVRNIRSAVSPHLLDFSQPFIMDLAQQRMNLYIWTGSQFTLMDIKITDSKSPYRVRAVVHLEAVPQALRNAKNGDKPQFVFRFLEMLTPIQRNHEHTDNNTYLAPPKPGELYLKQYRDVYGPWIYSPPNARSRDRWLEFIEASSKTQA